LLACWLATNESPRGFKIFPSLLCRDRRPRSGPAGRGLGAWALEPSRRAAAHPGNDGRATNAGDKTQLVNALPSPQLQMRWLQLEVVESEGPALVFRWWVVRVVAFCLLA